MSLPTSSRSARSALRAGACVAVLASGALLVTACSSSSGSGSSGGSAAEPAGSVSASGSGSGSGSASASASGGAKDMAAYRDCLSQHGVKLPSFSGRPSGGPSGGARPSGRPSGDSRGGFGGGFGGASADPATQKALDACASLRPQFNGQRGGGPGGGDSSAFQAFTSCLKDHGVTLPTPSPGATNRRAGGFGGGFGSLDTSDPKTAKAYTTCKPLLPTRAPSPSAT